MSFSLRLTLTAAAVSLLASCGGGSADSPPLQTSGRVVEGYLDRATVVCDTNGNGVADEGELQEITDSGGNFTFAAPGCAAGMLAFGGTDVDTKIAFMGLMKAPPGSTMITPLTTLLVGGMSQERVIAALGLAAGTDIPNANPALDTDLMRRSLAVEQLLIKTTEMFAGLGGVTGDALRAIYVEVSISYAILLQGGGTLIAGAEMDSILVAQLVKAATQRLAQSPSVDSKVRTALSELNAESVGIVTSGGLAVQAENILKASDAGLTGAATKSQKDPTITEFVTTPAVAEDLKKPPTSATYDLGADLTKLVADGLGEVTVDPVVPAPTNYLALVDDSISLINGASSTVYTLSQFQSDAGIRVGWPIPSPMLMKVALKEVGSVTLPAAPVEAAVSITETAVGGKGAVQAYVANVTVKKTAAGLEIAIPTISPDSLAYTVSTDAKKKMVIDFGGGVKGVGHTLLTAASTTNSLVFGEVVQYAINNISGQGFTGIYGLRGKYRVTVVLKNVPLSKADGTALPQLTVVVPTLLGTGGVVSASKTITGLGLAGNVTLTD